jgi:uncharacterized LabA/DUF88 family protein
MVNRDTKMIRYLFIDGGYLRDKFEKCMVRYYGEESGVSIKPCIPATTSQFAPVQKSFYYDCIDERRLTEESDEEFEGRVKSQEVLFASIRSTSGWHVREGRLVGARKQNRSQKRVDVLLAVEMLSHAFNKNMQTAILIAGDDDFTPLVEELLRHGTYVEVWSDSQYRSSHLVHAADTGNSMGYHFYWALAPESFRVAHPMPDSATARLHTSGRVVKFGCTKKDQVVKIVESNGEYQFVTKEPDHLLSRLRSRERRVLEEYLSEYFQETALLPDHWEDAKTAI